MRIGFVGLGKLGLPCALAVESRGHDVIGCDSDPNVKSIIGNRKLPYLELGAQKLLDSTKLELLPLCSVVAKSDMIFVAVQTPHAPQYEGITVLPPDRRDFDYSYLVHAISDICTCLLSTSRFSHKIIVVISTVLPGTMRREVLPIMPQNASVVYNPFFIAMGTTIQDFLHPEFILAGSEDDRVWPVFDSFYNSVTDAPIRRMSIESAELTKVAYNTMIGAKIVLANTMMEICHNIPNANVDDVMSTLKMATDRIVSTRYMDAGMGDGGGCHPRDNIAMSWLAKELNLSHNIFEDLMLARENQTFWMAELACDLSKARELPIVILGEAYKKGTNLTTGSAAILLRTAIRKYFKEKVVSYDPHVSPDKPFAILHPAIFFIGTNHDEFRAWEFPNGSVVLDPWGYIPDQDGIEVIRVGRNGQREQKSENKKTA